MTFHLKIMAREISAAVAACAQISDTATKIPILATTRIAVAGGFAEFTATNADQQIIVRAAGEGDGVACINVAALSAKLQTLRPNEPVEIAGDGKSVEIRQGRTKWKTPVLLDDFPIARPVEGEPVKLGKDFIAALNQSFSAIDPGEPRVLLQGASIGGHRVVSTNGKQTRMIAFDGEIPGEFIVPARVMSRIMALFPEGCSVVSSGNSAAFANDYITLQSKLIEGTFPDMDRLMEGVNANAVNAINLDAEEFTAAITRAAAIRASGEKSGSFINLQLRIRDGEVEIYTRNLEGEEGNDACRCERTEGGDADIGLNGAYLIASAQSLPCDTIQIRYGTERDPIIMSPVGSARENIRALMPRIFS